MAKEDEGGREADTTARRGAPKVRRFSNDEVKDLITALFALSAHSEGLEVPPLLLAHALGVRARILGAWDAVTSRSDDNGDA